ncbi:flagellar basal body-associated FliL family protein [Sandarakinorhabdus sp.]|uniref:flagellar basal body-associated FliL family protein n=1 Tax=Sandarakinorhabdus sp. TaxID=1916663 RepID=UPI00286DD896|nr:flagellar basal body-associated FliL family protein [Sandarakinorhabdus sp.]
MTDAPPTDAVKPKRNILGKLMPILAFVAGAGAGGGGAAIAVLQITGGAKSGGGHAEAPPPPKSEALEYIEIDNAFTSNLVDTGRYLQVKLSLSTNGGPEAVAAVEKHKPALISAVLAVLGDCGEADIADQKTKETLRGRLKDALNAALKGRGEPPAIAEVFFTSLVVQ